MLAMRRGGIAVALLTGCNLLLDNQVGIVRGDAGGPADGSVVTDGASGSSGAPLDASRDASERAFPVTFLRDEHQLTPEPSGDGEFAVAVPWSPANSDVMVTTADIEATSPVTYTLNGAILGTVEQGTAVPLRQEQLLSSIVRLVVEYETAAGLRSFSFVLEMRQRTRQRLPLPGENTNPMPFALAFDAAGARLAVGTPDAPNADGGVVEFTKMQTAWNPTPIPSTLQNGAFGSAVAYDSAGQLYVGAAGNTVNKILQVGGAALVWSGNSGFGTAMAAGPAGVFALDARRLVALGVTDANTGSLVQTHAAESSFDAQVKFVAAGGSWVVAGRATDATPLLAWNSETQSASNISCAAGARVTAAAVNDSVLVVGSPIGPGQETAQLEMFRRDGLGWHSLGTRSPEGTMSSYGRHLALCGDLLLVSAPEQNTVFAYRVGANGGFESRGKYQSEAPGDYVYGGSIACASGKVAISAATQSAGTSVEIGWVDVYE